MRLVIRMMMLLICAGLGNEVFSQQIVGKVVNDQNEPIPKIKIRIANIAS